MDLSRKSRMATNGATTQVTLSLTYYSIVSRYSVNLDFLISELNDLDIMACDYGIHI